MKYPVCGKEAISRLYYCARCVVYVHTRCWDKHVKLAHGK